MAKFIGSYYKRGGKLKDKHGNTRTEPITFRQRGWNNKGGFIVNEKGNFIGIEKNRVHHYGQDPKKIRKPVTFVRPNFPMARKPRRGHVRRL